MKIEDFEVEKCEKNVSLSEKGKKINLYACDENEFFKVKFDDVCSEKKGTRCDYVVYLKDKSVVLFAELKGSDVKRACEQILHSENLLKDSFGESNKYGAIAYSGNPDITTIMQKEKFKFRKQGFKECFTSSKILNLKYKNSKISK